MENQDTNILLQYVLDELTAKKEEASCVSNYPRYESAETGKLFEALAKAQGEMECAKNDSINPFFKSRYADLASVTKASRPYLCKNGLSVVQRIIPSEGGAMWLYTRLGHASGQWMESKIAIEPAKKDVQSLGSYITYLRRYAYSAIVGVVAGEEDDDAEVAMHSQRGATSDNKAGGKGTSDKISSSQLAELQKYINGTAAIAENINEKFHISRLSDLPPKHFDEVLTGLKEYHQKKVAK